MARTYNELDELVRKHSQLLINIGQAIISINAALRGKQDKLVYQVEDIKDIPQDICTALKCGDIVNKGNHSYRVTFKKNDEGMCLTYVDASRVETQSYDLTDGIWVYNSEDLVEFADYALKSEIPAAVSVITPQGTEPTAQGLRIGNTDYKIGGQEIHLYKHVITLSRDSRKCTFTLLTPYATPITYQTWRANLEYIVSITGGELTEAGSTTFAKPYVFVGKIYYTKTSANAWTVGCNYFTMNNDGTQTYSIYSLFTSGASPTFEADEVTQIF